MSIAQDKKYVKITGVYTLPYGAIAPLAELQVDEFINIRFVSLSADPYASRWYGSLCSQGNCPGNSKNFKLRIHTYPTMPIH
jgi:hypothetical protein